MLVAMIGSDERYLAKYGMKPADLLGVIPMGSIMWDEELEQAITQYGRTRVEQGWSRDPAKNNSKSSITFSEVKSFFIGTLSSGFTQCKGSYGITRADVPRARRLLPKSVSRFRR